MPHLDTTDPQVYDLLRALGARYSWGAGDLRDAAGRWPAGPFDCSGFAQAALLRLRQVRPGAWHDKSAHDLANACDPVELADAQLGDMAFYGRGGRISHVTVVLGAGVCIGANGGGSNTNGNTPSACVQVRPIVYRSDFVTIGRIKQEHRP
jgi:cell wall-associated NlpC family hydrolase